MISIPLTAAVFLSDPPTASPYGKLEAGKIVTNTGFPDFYFPEMVLDRTLTYNFTITFESGSLIAWAWAGNDADIYTGYSSPYAAFGYKLFNAFSPQLHPFTTTATTFSFEIDPTRWSGIPSGNNTPFFETHSNATVTAIEWDGPDLWGGGGVVEVVSNYLDSRSAFAS